MCKSSLPALAAVALATVFVAPAGLSAGTRWQAYADCAAGYLANWQDRRTDPSRTKSMADMIRTQSRDYETTAVSRYIDQNGAAKAQAQKAVQAYIQANLNRFIALDKNGKLNDLLDACPQPDSYSQ